MYQAASLTENGQALLAVNQSNDGEEERNDADKCVLPGVSYTVDHIRDPLQAYFKNIRRLPLLKKGEERDTAVRITSGRRKIYGEIFTIPLFVERLIDLGERAVSGEISLDTILDEPGGHPDERKIEPENHFFRAVTELKEIVMLGNRRAGGKVTRREKEPRRPKRPFALRTALLTRRDDILNHMADLALREEFIADCLAELREAHRRMTDVKKRVGCAEAPYLCAGDVRRLRDHLKCLEDGIGMRERDVCEIVGTIDCTERDMDSAKAHLVESNLRLVICVAKRYANKGIPFADLIQEGNIGLLKAVDRFDPARGYRFSTYAMWWIRQAMSRAIADTSRTIRIPVHLIEIMHRATRVAGELVRQNGTEPSLDEIAARSRVTRDKLAKVQALAGDAVSLETPVGEDDGGMIRDFIVDASAPTPLDALLERDLKDRIERVLATLTRKEEVVIRRRYGIGSDDPQTLEEIGREFHLSRERIRQIEIKALRKLRHPCRSRYLEVFMS